MKPLPELLCPSCRQVMRYKGSACYECRNDECDIIEVEWSTFLGKIIRVKRAADMTKRNLNSNDFRIGCCSICEDIVMRRAPADMAVCGQCYKNPGCVVEVPLKSPGEFLKHIAEQFFAEHKELGPA